MPKADEYPTCKSTYATLCVYHKSQAPEQVSRLLHLKASSRQIGGSVNPDHENHHCSSVSGLFLTTEGKTRSRDLRHHLDWLLDKIEGKNLEFEQLRIDGWWMDIACYWLSRRGHGGPTLAAGQMEKLSRLGIDIWFDVYFCGALVLDANDNVISPDE